MFHFSIVSIVAKSSSRFFSLATRWERDLQRANARFLLIAASSSLSVPCRILFRNHHRPSACCRIIFTTFLDQRELSSLYPPSSVYGLFREANAVVALFGSRPRQSSRRPNSKQSLWSFEVSFCVQPFRRNNASKSVLQIERGVPSPASSCFSSCSALFLQALWPGQSSIWIKDSVQPIEQDAQAGFSDRSRCSSVFPTGKMSFTISPAKSGVSC